MSKTKATPDTTLITLELDNHTTLDEQRRPLRRVTVTARKGALGYVGEALVANIEDDLLPILRHIQSVFFQAEVDGLPEWPDMNAPQQQDQTPPQDQAAPEADGTGEQESSPYTIRFYGDPPDQDAGPAQPELF